MKHYDVGIVGGGPIGGYVAKKIAEKNFKVAIFEEHEEIGEPVSCAGLVTPRVFDLINFSKELVVQNSIKGANIHSPSGQVLSIGGDKTHAFVINRSAFDKEIIKKAKEKTDIFLQNKVISAKRADGDIELKTSKKFDIKCKILIGADGPNSKIRKIFSLSQPKEYLIGIGAEIKNTNLNPDFVEIFIGKDVAPGFFAWIIPTNRLGTEARIGLCVDQNTPNYPKYYLSNFLINKISSPYLNDIEIIKKTAGIIPLGNIKKTYSSNVLIVGDAASQVKPTSGGGIYLGLLCAAHCASISIEALQEGNYSSSFLKKYHKLWTEEIGKELYLGMKFRTIFKNLTDKQMDKYIKKFQNTKIVETITKYGDIDYPSKLIKPLIKKKPSLIKFIPTIIKK